MYGEILALFLITGIKFIIPWETYYQISGCISGLGKFQCCYYHQKPQFRKWFYKLLMENEIKNLKLLGVRYYFDYIQYKYLRFTLCQPVSNVDMLGASEKWTETSMKYMETEPQNHRIPWVGRDHKDHLTPT